MNERPIKFLLAQTFLDKFSQINGRSFRGFTDEARAGIDAYAWPGNVRELENRIKRAVVLAEGKRVSSVDLGFEKSDSPQPLNLREARENTERQIIQRALDIHDNNVTHASEAMGISRPSLYKLVKKLGMPEPGK